MLPMDRLVLIDRILLLSIHDFNILYYSCSATVQAHYGGIMKKEALVMY